MQSIDLTKKKNAYGTSKDLVGVKEDIKCKNIIKTIQKRLTLMMLPKKT